MIRFKNKSQAQQAIAKNGFVVGGWTMIGIVLCQDESVWSGKQTMQEELQQRPDSKPLQVRDARQNLNVERRDLPGPRPYNSVWSKLWDYVIGV